jgi:diguanylate cyclase (GGDEF)-like protein
VWSLSEPLRSWIIAWPTAAVVAIGVEASTTRWLTSQVLIFVLLVGCGILAVEATGRAAREPQGTLVRDLLGVWYLATAIALPPVYALLAPVSLTIYRHWRISATHPYRRVFSNGILSLAAGCASTVFRLFPPAWAGPRPGTGSHLVTWTAAVVACGVVAWAINAWPLAFAVRLSDPTVQWRSLVASRESATRDLVELSLGVLVALLVVLNPALVVLVLPTIVLFRRYLLHSQLLSQSRIDGKTGLLNATTWEREASAELARAIRTRTPLAVTLLDLDRFKLVNDTYGHLAGDVVLKEVARTLSSLLRDYDLAGRFGGEEFIVLLPHTRAVDALRIAERIRAQIAGLSAFAPDGSELIPVTVSIGVAALEGGCNWDLADLLAASDAALYRAKSAGRDQVQMISTSRGLSAATGPADSGDAPLAFAV